MPNFPPAFLDELRARTPLAALIGRRVKLVRAGRQWKGCCPLHGEKTPSFHVYDDHFHCFGCGAHGDAVSFVMQSQGASFPEAVETLAREAGLEIPRAAEAPERVEAVSRERRLLAALEDAASLFEGWLETAPDGAAAREVLTRRGVSREVSKAWRLGWSGAGRALASALAARGHASDVLRDAGLLSSAEDGSIRGEMFRSRIMFPIADRRGRVIGFGGRALGDAQPKYLNGPETAVFSKRQVLFGHDRARARIRERADPRAAPPKLVIGEGYMDVLALWEAGFASVAPLGTALTEEQLATAWSLDPAPVLCLDGDQAGRRAAGRAAERALAALSPDRTLLIASLEEGEDPDSLLRRHGATVLGERIAAARPLSVALYELLGPPGPDATPEVRSAFRARLVDAASTIPDRSLAVEYRRTLLDRWFESTRRPGPARGTGRGARAGGDARGGARDGSRDGAREGARGGARGDAGGAARPALSEALAREEQACVLALVAWRHPDLRHDVEDAWWRVELPDWLARLRDLILAGRLDSPADGDHLPPSIKDEAGAGVPDLDLDLDRAIGLVRRHGELPACARAETMPAEAEAGWWHFFGLIQHGRLDEEIRAAEQRLARDFTEGAVRQMTALVGARAELRTLSHDVEP